MLLRHVLSEAGVATACSCRDLFSLQLMSRQLIDVLTFWSLQLLSRQPGVVATSILHNCCHDILMLSRPFLCTIVVATSSLRNGCRDNQVLSRPYLLWNCCRDNFLLLSRCRNYFRCRVHVATASRCRDIVPSFSSIPGFLSLSFVHFQLILFSIKLHLRLEFH